MNLFIFMLTSIQTTVFPGAERHGGTKTRCAHVDFRRLWSVSGESVMCRELRCHVARSTCPIAEPGRRSREEVPL